MKLKILFLSVFCLGSLPALAYATQKAQDTSPKELTFNQKQTIESLKVLYKKNLLNPQYISLILSSTPYLYEPFETWIPTLVQYREELQNKINVKLAIHGPKRYPASSKWFNVIGAAAYCYIINKMQNDTYESWLAYNTTIIEGGLLRNTPTHLANELAQRIAKATIDPEFMLRQLGQMIFQGSAAALTLYSATKLYDHYTYISSRENEVKLIDTIIAVLKEITSQL